MQTNTFGLSLELRLDPAPRGCITNIVDSAVVMFFTAAERKGFPGFWGWLFAVLTNLVNPKTHEVNWEHSWFGTAEHRDGNWQLGELRIDTHLNRQTMEMICAWLNQFYPRGLEDLE